MAILGQILTSVTTTIRPDTEIRSGSTRRRTWPSCWHYPARSVTLTKQRTCKPWLHDHPAPNEPGYNRRDRGMDAPETSPAKPRQRVVKTRTVTKKKTNGSVARMARGVPAIHGLVNDSTLQFSDALSTSTPSRSGVADAGGADVVLRRGSFDFGRGEYRLDWPQGSTAIEISQNTTTQIPRINRARTKARMPRATWLSCRVRGRAQNSLFGGRNGNADPSRNTFAATHTAIPTNHRALLRREHLT